MDCSFPGSSVHGIFQAGVLEWCAIAFSEEQIYLGINLPKEAKDLNSENHKSLMKEIEDGKMYHVLGLAESILSK